MLVPGAGQPNFDSRVADPYQAKRARREQEVHQLLDKLQPDMIVLDPTSIGQVSSQLREHNHGVLTRLKVLQANKLNALLPGLRICRLYMHTGSLPYYDAVPVMTPPSFLPGSCFKFDIWGIDRIP
jgi:hypothetical protein